MAYKFGVFALSLTSPCTIRLNILIQQVLVDRGGMEVCLVVYPFESNL